MSESQLVSGAQIRAARGLLKISAAELAQKCDLTLRTIQRFEAIDTVPPFRAGTLGRVVDVLQAAGIDFTGDPVTSPGVRLKRS